MRLPVPPSVRSVVLAGVALLLAGSQALAFDSPADPAYAWLAGKWTTGNIPWRQKLELNVGDGNRIGGVYDITDPKSGVTYTGSVEGEINGNHILLTATMRGYAEDFRISLERAGTILEGTRSGEFKSWSLLLTRVDR